MAVKKIFAVQTLYDHWSAYSGYQGFIPLLHRGYDAQHVRIPYGAKSYHTSPVLKKIIGEAVTNSGLALYSANDFEEEVKLFFQSAAGRPAAVHFLDGEHGYCHFTSLIKPLRLLRGGRPHIIVSYHLPPQRLLTRMTRYDHLARADKIVLVGSNQYDFFQKYVSAEKIAVIPHGVNTGFFSPPHSARPHDPELFTCLCIGSHLRDYAFLARVAEKLQGVSRIRFRVISPACDVPVLHQLHNVRIEAGLPDEGLLEAYRQADVLTMPLLDTTANNVVLEALACGLPVLTTNVGAIRDYVGESCAMLFAPLDTDGYADALADLARSPALAAEMGSAARAHAENHLSWKILTPRYERLYQ